MKTITFYKVLCVATSLLFVHLFIQLFYYPEAFVIDLGLNPSEDISILGRRASILMFGLSVLLLCSATLSHSIARQFICISTGIIFIGFASMGSYEFFKANINSSIIPAITIELIIGTSFLIIFFKNISKPNEQSKI